MLEQYPSDTWQGCVPDVPMPNVEKGPDLDLITARELVQHGIVVLGIVACYVSDLYMREVSEIGCEARDLPCERCEVGRER
jgi:hypothetical protein